MKTKFSPKLILLGIILIGAFFRFYGLNWDQGFHLHPDERFLTMVANAMRLPSSFSDYLNPQLSTFNPANVGFSFFVYGAFPIITAKILALITNYNTYDTFTFLGRILSAYADLIVIIYIFKLVKLFEKPYKIPGQIKFLAALFYAVSVLPIQLAHFFAVDTFLNLFVFSSFYFLVKFCFGKKLWQLFLSAFFLGLAVATKITAIFIIPLLLLYILPIKLNKKIFLLLIFFCLISYITLRFADPYIFANSNFFDLSLNPLFIHNLQTLKNLSDTNTWYPPNLQWLHKTPIIFALQNIALFGMGLPLFLINLIGIVIICHKYLKTKLFLIFGWCLLFFIYQSTQITKTMRYFIMLYPFLAIFSGFGFYEISKRFNKIWAVIFLIAIFIWPVAFMSIYTKDHSRVAATKWIYTNFPDKSIILTEYWDDALPLTIANQNNEFIIKELPVFDLDTPEKWNKMNDYLNQGDYLIISSNRGWGSIMQASEKYPQMSKFYIDLFAGKLPYKKIKTFTSYPALTYLGLPVTFADDNAEEAFTVYDHPQVMIFKKIN